MPLEAMSRFVPVRVGDQDAVQLTLHAGLGCGELLALCLGGVADRWEYVLAGDPIAKQIALTEPAAGPGETVASRDKFPSRR